MPSTRFEARAAAGLTFGLALAGAACSYQPAPTRPRPVLPPAIPVREAAPAIAPPATKQLTQVGADRWRGELLAPPVAGAAAEGEVVEFELWRTPGERRPLVLLVPILAGGAALMESVGRRLQDRGFDIAFCGRAGAALKPPQRGPELEELFRRTVLHQRLLLAWLRAPEHEPPSATFVLGMSLGGIVATAVAALEPELAGVAICLSGGDLPRLVTASSERRVRAWVDWRRQHDGVGTDELVWELADHLALEPVAMAASVPTGKVLFVTAALDTVIPRANRQILWEALGRPAQFAVPWGHYTAILAIDPIVGAAAAHFHALQPAAAPLAR